MSQEQASISCPNCGVEIDVNEILYHQVDEQLKKKYADELARQKSKYETESARLGQLREQLEAEKLEQKAEIARQVSEGVKTKELDLKKRIQAEAAQEQADALSSLREELNLKSEKIKELNKTSVELERLKREKDELEASIRAESEKTFNQRLVDVREKIQKEESDKNEMKLKELEKQLEDQKRLTEEMKRKQEQGSMQTQGEVQELAIEEWLAEKFPLDSIQRQGAHRRAVQHGPGTIGRWVPLTSTCTRS